MKKELLQLKHMTIEGSSGSHLHDISFFLREGECICFVSAVHQKELLVEYFKGMGKVFSGSIFIQNREVFPTSRADMELYKIFVIGCDTPYMNTLTIEENIFLLRRNSMKKFRLNESAMKLQTSYYFKKYGIQMNLQVDSSHLNTGDKILIGIIRSVSQGARVIVLHDLSRAFSKIEINRLTSLIMGLKREGIGVIISDNYPEYFYSAADQLVVFKHKQIAKKIYDPSRFSLAHEIVIKGVDSPLKREQEFRVSHENIVEIDGFFLDEKNRQIRGGKGEIILVSKGSIKMEWIWEQFMNFSHGKLTYTVDGRQIEYGTITDLIKQKIAFINPQVSYGGVLQNLSREDNILMPSFRKISSRFGFYKRQAKYILGDDFILEQGETLQNMDMGEHDWKTVLYRWKLYHPRVLILCNVLTIADMRERDWIKAMLMDLAERGTTVILLENESSCGAGIADRIEMMNDED